MFTLNFTSFAHSQYFFHQQELKKMSSIIPLIFNAVELRIVTINEKPLSRAKEV